MFYTFSYSLRSVARLLTALFLCSAFFANAQSTDRYYKIDKPTLEAMISTGAIEFEHPAIIVAQDEAMAMKSEFNRTSTLILSQPVTFLDDFVENNADNTDIIYKFYYIGSSNRYDGYEFNIISYQNYYLNTSSNKFNFVSSNPQAFTFIFDDTDDSRLQIKSKYYADGTYYNIGYNDAKDNEGFQLTADDSKSLSIYTIDYFNISAAEIDESDGSNIILKTNPYKNVRGSSSYINYILNDGSEVSISELLSSKHTQKINWKANYNEIALPIYDPEATTLWAIPALELYTSNPDTPYGPIFRATYSDISTSLTAPSIADSDEVTPIYYTLQGIRVSEPSAAGVYLCRRGSEITKIIVR